MGITDMVVLCKEVGWGGVGITDTRFHQSLTDSIQLYCSEHSIALHHITLCYTLILEQESLMGENLISKKVHLEN